MKAYRRTAFHVDFPSGRVTIRNGHRHPELDGHLTANSCWAYVTAFNPGSVPLSSGENQARQAALEQAALALGAEVVTGWGVGDGCDWPPERSCLVIGLDEPQAVLLARVFGQNAIVVGRVGERAKVRWVGSK